MEERIARNQAVFRSANERIHAAAGIYDVAIRVPFILNAPIRAARRSYGSN